MSVREYVGARYVPLFADPIDWDKSKEYEPLTIVLYQGNSYTSTQYVPKDIDITNDKFWAITGNYNAQIEQYRKEVADLNNKFSTTKLTYYNEISEVDVPIGSFILDKDSMTVLKIVSKSDFPLAVETANGYAEPYITANATTFDSGDIGAVINALIAFGIKNIVVSSDSILNTTIETNNSPVTIDLMGNTITCNSKFINANNYYINPVNVMNGSIHGSTGVQFASVKYSGWGGNLNLENIRLNNFPETLIEFNGAFNIVWDNVKCTNVGQILISNTSDSMRFSNCVFLNTDKAIELFNVTGGININVVSSTFEGFKCIINPVVSYAFEFNNCYFENNSFIEKFTPSQIVRFVNCYNATTQKVYEGDSGVLNLTTNRLVVDDPDYRNLYTLYNNSAKDSYTAHTIYNGNQLLKMLSIEPNQVDIKVPFNAISNSGTTDIPMLSTVSLTYLSPDAIVELEGYFIGKTTTSQVKCWDFHVLFTTTEILNTIYGKTDEIQGFSFNKTGDPQEITSLTLTTSLSFTEWKFIGHYLIHKDG